MPMNRAGAKRARICGTLNALRADARFVRVFCNCCPSEWHTVTQTPSLAHGVEYENPTILLRGRRQSGGTVFANGLAAGGSHVIDRILAGSRCRILRHVP